MRLREEVFGTERDMGENCRLFAVEADDFAALKTNPASILGRNVLRGAGWCDLETSWQAIHRLLTLPPNSDEAASFLLTGGYELERVDESLDPPRLLDAEEVKRFHRVLAELTDLELERRFFKVPFEEQVSRRLAEDRRPESDHWEYSVSHILIELEDSGEEDWTLEEAEDFERLVQKVESLRDFLTQAANRGQGVVIAFC